MRTGVPVLLALSTLVSGCARYAAKPLDLEITATALESRSLSDPALRAYLEKTTRQAAAQWPLQAWDFEMLSVASLYFHPEINIALTQWREAAGAEKTASARPNPTLSFSPEYATNPDPGMSPWIAAVSFDIPIETAGKRSIRMHEARSQSDAAKWHVLATAWEIRRTLRAALLDHEASGHKVELLQERAALQERALALFEQQKKVGEIQETEIFPVRTTHASTLIELNAAKSEHAQSRSRIAAAIGVPVAALEAVRLSAPIESRPISAEESRRMRRAALENRSDVREALSQYEASQSALQLEIAKQYPNVHIGPGYQYDQGENKWSVGVGIELPIFNRNEGPIAEAYAKREEAAARVLAKQAVVLHELDAAMQSTRDSSMRLTSAQGLLEAGSRNLRSLSAQHEAGAGTQVEVLVARSEQVASELALLEATVEVARARADWIDTVQMSDDIHSAAVLDAAVRPPETAAQRR